MRATAFIVFLFGCGDSADSRGDGGVDRVTSEQAIAACVNFTSCYGRTSGLLMNCFLFDLPVYHANEIRCLAAAGAHCDQMSMCFEGETLLMPLPSQCTSLPGINTYICDGADELFCGYSYAERISCSARTAGSSCMTATDGSMFCSTGACTDPTARCVGTVLTSCVSGLQTAFDCASERPAHICRVDNGMPHCIGGGAACTPRTARCDGTGLANCYGGQEATIDCTAMGGTCESPNPDAGPTQFPFCGFGTDCDPMMPSSCTGTKLTFCAAGALTTIDCASLGFRDCVAGICVP